MPEPLIEATGLIAGYGSTVVVRGIDLVVNPGEVVGLLGPNGAGKTTTLLTLAGELPLLGGQVKMDGRVARAACHRRARAGLGYVTEERSVFMQMTVADNLRVAGVANSAAVELFPELAPFMKKKAGQLSGGQQQMLALARMLARRPRLLLVDELSLGLAPLVVKRLLKAVRAAATDQGVGVLLVEQHVRQVLDIADRVYVLTQGGISLEGPVAGLRDRIDEIESSYFVAPAG
jgi:branched-chain amino acid transport system ATP-binding protein